MGVMIAIRHSEACLHGVPVRRVLIALGASLLVHFLIAGWSGSGKARDVADAPAPLQARLELNPVVLPSAEKNDHPPVSMAVPPAELPRRTAPVAAATVRQPPTGVASAADSRFYLARELDRYPSPLSALGPGDDRGTAGSVRLWVSIDEAGRVVDATVIDPDPPGESGRLARERVLATSFISARRDGRPVKSRILLVLRQGI